MIAQFVSIIKKAFKGWSDDDAFSDSASIAYYAILSLPGLIVLIIYLLGFFLGKKVAEGEIDQEVSQVLGENASKFIETLMHSASKIGKSTTTLLIGGISISLSATAVFLQIQKVLNKIWKIKPHPTKKAGIMLLLTHRLLSFGLIIFIGIFILASSLIAGAIAMFRDWISSFLPGGTIYIFYGLSFIISFMLLALFFAIIFKFLPDGKVDWKTVWVGGAITAFLFFVGMVGLQFYFSIANPTSTYGAAGSAILILLWTFYSSLIFLLGAQFTKVYALNYTKKGIQPSKYAVRVER